MLFNLPGVVAHNMSISVGKIVFIIAVLSVMTYLLPRSWEVPL